MVLNKTKGIIIAVVLLFVGYLGGAYIGVPFVDKRKLSGDIGKAKLYNNATGGYANADAEKLLNDTLYQQEMGGSVALLAARVNAADSLVGATVAATGGIDSLADINRQMQLFAVKTKNAKQAFNDLMATMNSVIGGDNGGGGDAYEQQLNNAVLAYTAVDNMMSVCPEYAETFLACGKASSDEKLLSLAGGWIQYGAEDALFNGSEEDIAAWQNVYADLAKDGGLAKMSVIKNFPTVSKLVSAAKLSCRSFGALSKVNNGVYGTGFVGLAKVEMQALNKADKMSALNNSDKMSALNNSDKMQALNNSNRIALRNSNRIFAINKAAASSHLGLRSICLQRVTGVTPPQMNTAY